MNATEVTTADYLSFDYPFSLALISWSYWFALLSCWVRCSWSEGCWEYARCHSSLCYVRWWLAAVCWMLLAPTRVLDNPTSTKKAIAILADASGSMSTVHPPGTADDLRWQAASSNEILKPRWHARSPRLTEASLRWALYTGKLSLAVEALDQHGGRSSVAEPVALASQAFARSKRNLADVRAALRSVESVSFQDESIESLMFCAFRTCWKVPRLNCSEELVVLLENNRTSIGAGWRESLPDLAL